MESSKIFTSLITGVMAGAALGILFAPNKGTVSRDKIYKKGDDLLDDLESKFSNLNERIKQQVKGAKNEMSEMAEKGMERAESEADNLADKSKDKAEKVKAAVNK